MARRRSLILGDPAAPPLDPILTNFRAGMSDHMHSAGPNSPGQGHPIQCHGSFHQGQRSARLSMDPCRLVMLDVVTSSANQSLPNVRAIRPADEGITVVQCTALMNLPRLAHVPVRMTIIYLLEPHQPKSCPPLSALKGHMRHARRLQATVTHSG